MKQVLLARPGIERKSMGLGANYVSHQNLRAWQEKRQEPPQCVLNASHPKKHSQHTNKSNSFPDRSISSWQWTTQTAHSLSSTWDRPEHTVHSGGHFTHGTFRRPRCSPWLWDLLLHIVTCYNKTFDIDARLTIFAQHAWNMWMIYWRGCTHFELLCSPPTKRLATGLLREWGLAHLLTQRNCVLMKWQKLGHMLRGCTSETCSPWTKSPTPSRLHTQYCNTANTSSPTLVQGAMCTHHCQVQCHSPSPPGFFLAPQNSINT